MIPTLPRAISALAAITLVALAGCTAPTAPASDPAGTPAAAPSESASTPEASAPETSAPAVAAPQPKGPWKPGMPVPKVAMKGADVKVPAAVGERVGGDTADGMTMYQAPSGGSIGTIALEKQQIDFYLKTGKNPVDYGDFVCAEGAAWGGGPMCMIGLTDGTLSFQNSAGPDASIEGSAQFAAEALAQMNVK